MQTFNKNIYVEKDKIKVWLPKELYLENYFTNIKDREKDIYKFFLNEIVYQRRNFFYKYDRNTFDIKTYHEKKLYDEGWVQLSSSRLRDYYNKYKIILKELIDNKIIEVYTKNDIETYRNDTSETDNGFAKRYRINPDIMVKSNYDFRQEYIASNKPLLKSINKHRFSYKIDNLIESNLFSTLCEINIHENDARQELYDLLNTEDLNERISLDSYNYVNARIDSLVDEEWYFKKDDYGRIHTNVTTLKKCCRKHLYFKGDEDVALVNVDITNSQPFFLTLLFNKDVLKKFRSFFNTIKYNILRNIEVNKDCLEFKRIVEEGKFYEYLMEKTGLSRDKVKEEVFILFFSQKGATYSKLKIVKALNENLPDFLFFLIELKKEYTGEELNFLPKLLQRLESHFIYNEISHELIENIGFSQFITIHDSFLVQEGDEKYIIDAFNKVFKNNNLTVPKIKIEK